MSVTRMYDLIVSGSQDDLARFMADPRCISPETDDDHQMDKWWEAMVKRVHRSDEAWDPRLVRDAGDEACHLYLHWSMKFVRGMDRRVYDDWFTSLVEANPGLVFALDIDYSDGVSPNLADSLDTGRDGQHQPVGFVEWRPPDPFLVDLITPMDWLRSRCASANEHRAASYCHQCEAFNPGSHLDWRVVASDHDRGAHVRLIDDSRTWNERRERCREPAGLT